MPGPTIRPNFMPVMEAISNVTFPISKRDLLEQVGDETVLLRGRNLSLHDLIKDIHDDAFDSDGEFLAALESQYGAGGEAGADEAPAEGEPFYGAPGWSAATERAGPVESGRGAMVRSGAAEDERRNSF